MADISEISSTYMKFVKRSPDGQFAFCKRYGYIPAHSGRDAQMVLLNDGNGHYNFTSVAIMMRGAYESSNVLQAAEMLTAMEMAFGKRYLTLANIAEKDDAIARKRFRKLGLAIDSALDLHAFRNANRERYAFSQPHTFVATIEQPSLNGNMEKLAVFVNGNPEPRTYSAFHIACLLLDESRLDRAALMTAAAELDNAKSTLLMPPRPSMARLIGNGSGVKPQ